MKARKATRYFASSTDMTSPDQARRTPGVIAAYGTCPTWAAESVAAGLAVASETVLVVGTKREPCFHHPQGHLVVPPPWTD